MKKSNWIVLALTTLIVGGCSFGSSDYDSGSYKRTHHYDPSDWRTYQGSEEQQKDLEMLDKWEQDDPESFYGL